MTECEVNENELHKIALGACFLGSGGGGKLETSFTFIKNYCDNLSEDEKKRNLQIADLGDVKAGQSGIVVAYMGAPQKMDDIKCPDAVCEVINKFGNDKGIDYIIPVEIGPVSTIAACLTAHKMGKPVLNVDGAGRAVPTLDLITYTTNAGVSVNPTILCSENGNKKTTEYQVYHQVTLTLEVPNDTEPGAASKMESLARPVLNMPEFDQKAGLVMWYFEDVTKLMDDLASVKETLTFCHKLGGAIQSMQGENWEFSKIEELFKSQSIYPSIKENYPAIREMCRGELKSATTLTAGGFDVGVITIKDNRVKGDPEHFYKIIFQNESLLLWDSDSPIPLVMAPDLISYSIKDKQKQYVFTNGDIMLNGKLNEDLEGTEIIVYGIAAPEALTESEKKIMDKRKDILSNTNADVEHNALPEHYMSILNTVGYYGRCKSLKE